MNRMEKIESFPSNFASPFWRSGPAARSNAKGKLVENVHKSGWPDERARGERETVTLIMRPVDDNREKDSENFCTHIFGVSGL